MRTLVIGLCGLFLAAVPTQAVDYSRISRDIAREPVYRSKAPRYALLLFGPEARLRIWAVLDGKTLYLDRNGDGDLTGKDERFEKVADCKNVGIADPDGKTRYVITSISLIDQGQPTRQHLMVDVDVKGPLEYRQYCDVAVANRPQKAALAHFHGPLTAGVVTVHWKVPPGLHLVTGEKATDLRAVIGTLSGEHGCWVVVRSHQGDASAFDKGVHPLVEVEYPAKAPGGQTIKRRYPLDRFC